MPRTVVIDGRVEMPGLNKVARKLNVDCASAMVGWEFHGGINHPVYVISR